ncbi:MAG: hypothetical protein IPP07_22215 [Holophagales bacterium]|nr:hypothetical protein [Holophagales bacterium]MBK9967438.1 hypothetical protein [Holophagales bacterium]
MAVKWIGDAAQELGITPLDAVEILASRQEYPMNGLVDEDRFKTLRLMRGGKRLETSGSQAMPLPERHASPATAPISAPAPPAPEPLRAAATPPPAPFAPAPSYPAPPPPVQVIPAPPPVRPAVGEATSITAPLQTIPGREDERTVILAPVDPKR